MNLVTLDGNQAAAHIAYDFTEVAAIYPITPSSPMAEHTDEWSAAGRKNMFGQPVVLTEMQSEAGAIGAIHGAAQTGALATTYTSSQGLMLMIPTLHRIAGERLPVVLHVAARTVGTHAMSIFGDHSDVMCCRNTGLAMLCSGSVQEVIDLAGVAHLAALKGRTPFMHFFDGFRTSHEINTVEMIDTERLHALLDRDALQAFRHHALNPEHPLMRSTVQNPDVYFQAREACNTYYDELPFIVAGYLDAISHITGRSYHLFDYYGAADATDVVIAMGSVAGTIKETVDALNATGRKTGFVQVHLYRPFSVQHFVQALPQTVQRIAVLDRCKEPGAVGEPLYEDVCAALSSNLSTLTSQLILGGRYGLSSKDTDPSQIVAVFDNLLAEQPKNGFTIGIQDDVTGRSLPAVNTEHMRHSRHTSYKFWGLGGDGTVGANKNTVHIVSEYAHMYGQAYFEYDAKKSFGVTKSHLRFSHHPIESSYYVRHADFVACHNESYVGRYDMVSELRPGGIFLLNTTRSGDNLVQWLPADVRQTLHERHIRFFVINASEIAQRLGLGSHTNTVLQAAFFAVSGIMAPTVAAQAMKDATRATYFAKGEAVVDKNLAAIDAGMQEVKEVNGDSWISESRDLQSSRVPEFQSSRVPEFQRVPDASTPLDLPDLVHIINAQQGDTLPVSAFVPYVDGTIPLGLTAHEKRGIATRLPLWDAECCVQCNRCSLVCPHAAIRPFLLDDDEDQQALDLGLTTLPAIGARAKGLHYTLLVSVYDCTGCGSCAESCKVDALQMQPALLREENKRQWDFALALTDKSHLFEPYSVKGSQMRRPLLEFSAACAGCGETPYAKLLTQLFGDSIYWANATGCSQAWGAAMPGIPYQTNARGCGPAWTNSLFENNAELCYGMYLAVTHRREQLRQCLSDYIPLLTPNSSLLTALQAHLEAFDDLEASRATADALVIALQHENTPEAQRLLLMRDLFRQKTFWMYGGDGWAYDIGYGGLDHVVSTGANINVFVIDTEIYSNTGGQSSKATPLGAVAKFASAGKESSKKDLGALMMTYGNVYVAQVAMGADPAGLLRAIHEAQSYDGPSVIIAYTPCASHGICRGMQSVQEEMRRAVESGYWLLYRYDPRKEEPFQLDSPAPTLPYQEFLEGETRYAALRRTFPQRAEQLFAHAAEEAQKRYEKYKKR